MSPTVYENEAPPEPPSYEQRVEQVAAALHEECVLEWQAIAVADPERLLTQHMPDAHYERAHFLVRRLWPDLDDAIAAALRATPEPPQETNQDLWDRHLARTGRIIDHPQRRQHEEDNGASWSMVLAASRMAPTVSSLNE